MPETFDYQPAALLDPGGPVLWSAVMSWRSRPVSGSVRIRSLSRSAPTTDPSWTPDDERANQLFGMGYWRVTHWAKLWIEDEPSLYARVVMMVWRLDEATGEYPGV